MNPADIENVVDTLIQHCNQYNRDVNIAFGQYNKGSNIQRERQFEQFKVGSLSYLIRENGTLYDTLMEERNETGWAYAMDYVLFNEVN